MCCLYFRILSCSLVVWTSGTDKVQIQTSHKTILISLIPNWTLCSCRTTNDRKKNQLYSNNNKNIQVNPDTTSKNIFSIALAIIFSQVALRWLHWSFYFALHSSTPTRSFTCWSWQQLSSTSTGSPTCRNFATASREDAQMTRYSEGHNCDLTHAF